MVVLGEKCTIQCSVSYLYPQAVPFIAGSISKSAPLVSKLLIVPTQFELECLSNSFREQIRRSDWQLELCGFGIVVSGLRTCELITQYSPKQVLLIGIAGTLSNRFLVGQAVEFDEVACFGIGAGSGDQFLSAHEMGWQQWPHSPEVSDCFSIRQPSVAGLANQTAKLLTCCSASATEQEVEMKLRKYPNAVAEDMEGFSVAAACRFADIPLTIVRGISNRAGDRNKENWRVREAMLAVEQQVYRLLSL